MGLRNPYNASSIGKEIDLRSELHRLLFGAADEIPKGKIGLLRRMRKDNNNQMIRCPCRNELTDEPDRDYYCRTCNSMGFLWDEYKIVYYKNNESFKEDRKGLFYLEYGADVTKYDFIIEVALNSEGVPLVPVRREAVYDIILADPFRADNGRIEFWNITAQHRRDWSTWYGVIKNRQLT
jgi:hypothetical protein